MLNEFACYPLLCDSGVVPSSWAIKAQQVSNNLPDLELSNLNRTLLKTSLRHIQEPNKGVLGISLAQVTQPTRTTTSLQTIKLSRQSYHIGTAVTTTATTFRLTITKRTLRQECVHRPVPRLLNMTSHLETHNTLTETMSLIPAYVTHVRSHVRICFQHRGPFFGTDYGWLLLGIQMP